MSEPQDPNEPTPPPYGAPDYGQSSGGGPSYGEPTQPISPTPPPPPAPASGAPENPYAPTNPYAPAPPPNPYAAPSGYPPASGGPGAPYGPAYGGPSELAPSKAMAIVAMVFSFLCCLSPVGIILGIIVLVRGRDGRDRGKGLAIGAIIVGSIVFIASIAIIGGIAVVATQYKNVNDLTARQCFDGIKGSGKFSNLRVVDCSDPHDGQVLATVTLSRAEAREYADSDELGGRLCAEAIGDDAELRAYLLQPALEPLLLTDLKRPDPGDKVACVVHRVDGKKITDSIDDPADSTPGFGLPSDGSSA